jgi:serine/threonine protein kinase
MHQVDVVHGDLKPENVLVFRDDSTGCYVARVADFGKAQVVHEGERRVMMGDPMMAAPEGDLSMHSEVYSAALLTIQLLEMSFLPATGTHPRMLIDPPDPHAHPHSRIDQGDRRGIERFLAISSATSQSDKINLWTLIKRILGRLLKLKGSKSEQRAVHAYINELTRQIEAMVGRFPQNPQRPEDLAVAQRGIQELNELLKEMTRADPSRRPRMDEVVARYQVAVASIQEYLEHVAAGRTA